MVTITYIWNKHARPESCVKCTSLEGWVWTFENETAPVLIHPTFGVVWDLMADEPRTHGSRPFNCKCWLTIDIDDSDLLDDLNEIEQRTTKLDGTLQSCSNYLDLFLSLMEGLS